jgi:hypothetical protein
VSIPGVANLVFTQVVSFGLRLSLADVQADQEAEESATEAEIANARVETFLADELNHEILDREMPRSLRCYNA